MQKLTPILKSPTEPAVQNQNINIFCIQLKEILIMRDDDNPTNLQLSQASPTPSPSTSRCPGFATLGQLSFWSNTESPSASWLEIEHNDCWAFVSFLTCRHLQHCPHRCPSGQGFLYEDNCHRHHPLRHLHNSPPSPTSLEPRPCNWPWPLSQLHSSCQRINI